MNIHKHKKLFLSIETESESVNRWLLIEWIKNNLKKHFSLPDTLTGIWEGIKTTDKHGMYAFPQFNIFMPWICSGQTVSKVNVVWDKIYFRDTQKAHLKFFSNDKGWCWFNKFADDQIITMFLMGIRDGIYDYIKGIKGYKELDGKGFYIFSRDDDNYNDCVQLDYIPKPERRN